MKIFKAKDIRNIDKLTIEEENITSAQLMERAGIALKNAMLRFINKSQQIIILAGQGNNGGDALVIARLLAKENYNVCVFLLNASPDFSQDNLTNSHRLHIETSLNPQLISNDEDITKCRSFVSKAINQNKRENIILIDGLFGSGLNREIKGTAARLIRSINEFRLQCFAIDIPSGLFSEPTISDNSSILKATRTFSIEMPKLSLLLAENYQFVGDLELVNIGLSGKAKSEIPSMYCYIDHEYCNGMLHKRRKFSHKGDYGNAMLMAGSKGMVGASILAANAAMRSGLGKLTIYAPECAYEILQISCPEAMVKTSEEKDTIDAANIDLQVYDNIAIGPGISTNAVKALQELLKSYNKPLVLDADALNIISENKELFEYIPKDSILCPHPKEFDRLSSPSTSSYERICKAMNMASSYSIYIILKGAHTIVVCPDNRVFFNSTGNPGMATAGSGDVLCGIVLSLLCQNRNAEEAAVLAVYLHGLAGDFAAKDLGEDSLIASDIIKYLPKAFKAFRKIL